MVAPNNISSPISKFIENKAYIGIFRTFSPYFVGSLRCISSWWFDIESKNAYYMSLQSSFEQFLVVVKILAGQVWDYPGSDD